ncbi:MAG TPA: amidase [Thermoanaerobaculia bacterium]|nr:amidase [Thermoanaerobaculia bacterium]
MRTISGLTRRSLFGYGAAASVAAAALPGRLAAAVPEAPTAASSPFPLEEATFADLAKKMDSGEETAQSLAEKYLARIEAIDRRGPDLRSVLEINPDALAIAADLDAERRARGARGPLHGIPILVKDNVGTRDRMSTSAGSLALEGVSPKDDSAVARRLREAGAVILGKTNLSEWANFRSAHSSSGWSGRGGQCRNPYVLDRNPSGSSSGSGAAVAANLAAAAIGTETDGSIVSPSSACGVVGIKPTLGLVSRSGIVPIAHSQDTAGPMARTVRDAALLLAAIAAPDPADSASRPAPFRVEALSALDASAIRGARLGVVRKSISGNNAATDRVADAAFAALKDLGAVLVDPADIDTVSDFDKSELEVLLYEFKADLNAYLAALPNAPVRTLAELIAFNEKHRDREMRFFGQDRFERAEEKGPLTEKAYRKALASDLAKSRAKGIDAALAKNRLDALVCATGGPARLTDLVNGGGSGWSDSTVPAIAGYPHVTVPMGFVFGLPVGFSFFGSAWSEPRLLSYALAFEQATRHRKPPGFLATVNLSA